MTESLFLIEALRLFTLHFTVIPTFNKKTVVKWDPWIEKLSVESITAHWTKYPDHELGIIPGDRIVVYDADTPQAVARLYEIEEACDCHPKLISKTAKGEHHWFSVPDGILINQRSFSTDQYPENIDVKTGRCLVVVPPSTNKEWLLEEAFDEE